MSQKALADKIGIRQPSLSELENGESQGSVYLPQIASVLGVNPLWLATGKGTREVGAGQSLGAGSTGSLALKAETAGEMQLLMVYRSANERERKEIDAVIEDMRLLIEARARDQAKRTG